MIEFLMVYLYITLRILHWIISFTYDTTLDFNRNPIWILNGFPFSFGYIYIKALC